MQYILGCDGSPVWLNQLMLPGRKSMGVGEFLLASDYFEVLITFAASYGASPDQLLKGSEVTLAELFSRPPYVGNDSYNAVINNLIEMAEDPLLPWKYGLALSSHSHGVCGLALRSSKSLYDALQLLPTFFATRVGYAQSIELRPGRRYFDACLRSSRPLAPNHIVRFNTISSLTTVAWLSRNLIGAQDKELNEEAHFAWPDPGVAFPKSLLPPGTKVSFAKKETLLRFQSSHLRSPVITSSPELQKAALKECELQLASPPPDTDIDEQVVWVFRVLRPTLPTIEVVAEHLHMSAASLKRKLNAKSTTFQELKNTERFNRVIQLLKLTDLPLEKIAHEVGFSDSSNLSKAFRIRFGQTPGDFRQTKDLGEPISP